MKIVKPNIQGNKIWFENETEILRAIRIPRLTAISELSEKGLIAALEKAIERTKAFHDFVSLVKTYKDFEISEETLRIENQMIQLSSYEIRALKNVSQISFMMVCLHQEFDELIDSLIHQNEPAEAWFMDALGSKLIDKAIRKVEHFTEMEMKKIGLKRTRRCRPGYGDWGLEAQKKIYDLLQANKVGVSISEEFILQPKKTITQMMGWVIDEKN